MNNSSFIYIGYNDENIHRINYPNSKLGNRGFLTNLFGAAANLFRRVDDFGTNIVMTGIKHGVNLAKGTFLVCHLAESGIPTCAIHVLCT